MSAIIKWNIPADLVTPAGTLTFNAPVGGGVYRLIGQRCSARIGLRAQQARQNLPHFDGSTLNDRWFEGAVLDLAVRYWQEGDTRIACDSLEQTMHDTLLGHLRTLPRADTVSDNRFRFTPDGEDRRIFDQVRLLRDAEAKVDEEGFPTVSFALDSPFPYAIDLTQTEPAIAATHTNAGTAKFYPVIKVTSGTAAFTIENTTNGDRIVYSGATIGGSYGEYDAFRGTFFQDGDDASVLAGVDPEQSSKEFGLEPGANVVTMSGGSGTMLLNSAWA